jgi:hypothetical protein
MHRRLSEPIDREHVVSRGLAILEGARVDGRAPAPPETILRDFHVPAEDLRLVVRHRLPGGLASGLAEGGGIDAAGVATESLKHRGRCECTSSTSAGRHGWQEPPTHDPPGQSASEAQWVHECVDTSHAGRAEGQSAPEVHDGIARNSARIVRE